MADTRMKIRTSETHEDDVSVPLTVRMTVGMRHRISRLCEVGIYGITVEEVAERLICRQLQDMDFFK